MNMRIAARNLLRNRWRSALTAGGISVAVAMIVWFSHFSTAMVGQMVASVTDAELGDAQINSKEYVEERSLYAAFEVSPDRLSQLRKLEGVAGAAPRVQAFGLVGHEKHSAVARIVGVDAAAESLVTATATRVDSGEWLSESPAAPPAAREVVLGKTLAAQLEVGVGDELVVFLQAADGSLGNDLLKIRGIAATGNSNLDRMAVWMHLADVQWLTALEGRAHEIAIATEQGVDVADVVAAATTVLADDTLVARTWYEIMPEFYSIVQLSTQSMWIFYIVIFLIAGLGIMNTQRMTALERRREFGVLLAIGTTPGRLGRQVIAEAVLLTLLGAVLGVVLGGLASWYHQIHGLDMRSMASGESGELNYMGVAFDRFYFHVNASDMLTPLGVVTFVGLLCGVWPAISSARLDMPRAISGRT